MKRVDITKDDNGKYKYEVRHHNVADGDALASNDGFDTLEEAVASIEELQIEDDFYFVLAPDDKPESSEDAVTSLAGEASVRTANYGGGDDDGDVPTSTIETLG